MALTKIGATLGGSADVIQVTQSSHGLSLGYPVKVSGNGTYAHATADSATNAEAIGIIIATTTDTMTIALGGRITIDGVLPSGNLAAGTVLFLHTSAGKLTATEPSGNNEVSKPMAVITYLNSEMIMIQQRGEVISTAGVVSAPIDVNYLVGTANSTLSAEIVVGTAPGGELGNTWASPTVDSTHSGSAHHADAHTVASHSDTTGTGAELETLTDGSTTALHVHAARKLDDLATPDDNTDLNVSTTRHGLVPKITSTSNFLKGDGTWAAAGGNTNISCRVYNNAAQSISNGANTILNFNQEASDTGLMHDNSTNNSRITIPSGEGGVYVFAAIVMWAHNTTGQRHVEFRVNGNTSLSGYTCNGVVGDASASLALTFTIIREFSAGDYVEIRVYHAANTALNINGTTEQAHTFSCVKVA